jgi:hypothetical protein
MSAQYNDLLCKHRYIVVSWDGDVARMLMCQHCLHHIRYKDIKKPSKVIDAEVVES